VFRGQYVVYLAESYGGDNENHYSKLEEQRCLSGEKINMSEWQTKTKTSANKHLLQ